eukprot:TRINITY_DN66381_c7_g2_i1.p1 TRINITY_DN66381_c7_g2~~TRINITY_DN66381_c7_g2_i1.p1  ORF type:complete len:185 (+),score=9.42 TRINITY_DN66381_c7_g2_i1:281-835(+)
MTKECRVSLTLPAAISLAVKVENQRCSSRRIYAKLQELDPAWFNKHNTTETCSVEYYMLSGLGFSLFVYHPFRDLKELLAECSENCDTEQFAESAWSLVNDSYYTTLPMLYPPYQIALGCLVTAALNENVNIDGFLKHLDNFPSGLDAITQQLADWYTLRGNSEFKEKQREVLTRFAEAGGRKA